MRALRLQTLIEIKLVLRRRQSLIFALLLPVFLLIFSGSLYGSSRYQHIKSINFVLPQYAVLGILGLALNTIAITIAFERQYGILKRLGGTPLPRQTLIVAKIGAAVVLITAVEVVLFVLGVAAYGASLKGNAVLVVLILVVGMLCFAAWGITLGGLAKPDSVQAFSTLVFLFLGFLGGVFVPLQQFPSSLRNFALVLPSSRMVDGLQQVMTYGHGFTPQVRDDLVVIAIWLFVALAWGRRRFRWE
jgi:ABC-2 type transport system permease protein